MIRDQILFAKMNFSWTSTCLITFLLISLTVNSFQELILSQEPTDSTAEYVNFTCTAEDDGAALALNLDLRYLPEDKETAPIHTRDIFKWTKNIRDDYRSAWQKVSSLEHPMGPVYDYRWEGFEEYSFDFTEGDQWNYKPVFADASKSGMIILSARGRGNISIAICELGKDVNDSCFRVIIDAWPSLKFGIPSHYTENNQQLINEYKWRAFIVEWDTTQNKLNIQPNIHNYGSYFVKAAKKVSDVWTKITLHIGKSEPGRVRLHLYNYLLTTTKNAMLFTDPFQHHEQTICIELLVSLCSECKLKVSVWDASDMYIGNIGEIYGNNNSAHDKLPTWRFEKLHATLPMNHSKSIKIVTSTRINNTFEKGRWAIDNFRKCGSPDIERKISFVVPAREKHSSKGTWAVPVVWCQKLSYTDNFVVRPDSMILENLSENLEKYVWRKQNKYWPYQMDNWYKGTSFCNPSGCICAPGFQGYDCTIECSVGSYGYSCRNKCGHCKSQSCHKTSGLCEGECSEYHLPPYCVQKLEAPMVSNVTETTAALSPRYSATSSPLIIHDIKFELKAGNGNWIMLDTKSQNPYIAELAICSLLPETIYTVRTVIEAMKADKSWTVLRSPENNFSTSGRAQISMTNAVPCSSGACNTNPNISGILASRSCTQGQAPSNPLNFTVTSKGRGVVILNWNHSPYICARITGVNLSIELISTNLLNRRPQNLIIHVNYSTTQFEQTHSMSLDLSTSTCYSFKIQAIILDEPSESSTVVFQVPASVGFRAGEAPEISRDESFIYLGIPAVVNATKNSIIVVVVKGSPICEHKELPQNLKKLLNMTDSEVGWIDTIIPIQENTPVNRTIGQSSSNINGIDCLLRPEITYEVVVILKLNEDEMWAFVASSSTKRTSAGISRPSFSWIAILLILIISTSLLLIWRRKFLNAVKRMRRQNLISYSQTFANFLKSTTTCTSRQLPSSSVYTDAVLAIDTTETVTWNPYSYPVNIEDFKDYVKDSIASKRLESQFLIIQMFPSGLNKPCKYGSLPENKPKNRYANIIAYDDSRVILKNIPGKAHSDYINANHVQGFHEGKAYIATQGPKPQTVVDFWRMIWQEGAQIICMLTNIVEGRKVKCEQYWPEFGANKTYGDIVVVTEKHDVFADYTFRTLRVSCKEESRRIEHLHYTGWPDHTVPMYLDSVIAYLQKLQTVSVETGPIIVHCSAGIGRTGTIILCDICLRQAAVKKTIDVLAEFKKLRDSRPNMVDNIQQYLFVHLVLTEYLMYNVSLSTKIVCNNDLPLVIEEQKKKLPQYIKRLYDTAWLDQAFHPQLSSSPLPLEQLAKNRFPELAPVSINLLHLTRYPTHDSYSDYISTVIVDGVRVKKQYLASQLPLPSTLSDFWRLIAEQRIELVVILQQPDRNDPTCCDIIPVERLINPVPFINVELKKSLGSEYPPRVIELLLTDTSEVTPRTQRVTMMTCLEWGPGRGGKPPSPIELVELWTATESIHREKGPTLVLCHDGVTGCGLYIALSLLLERMAVEQECDVIFAVRAIRRSRTEFVQSKEQFEYLYDAAVKYVESFETYANLM